MEVSRTVIFPHGFVSKISLYPNAPRYMFAFTTPATTSDAPSIQDLTYLQTITSAT